MEKIEGPKISRRSFHKGFVVAGVAFATGGTANSAVPTEFDFIVVGAGPGGGPLAARLAKAGYTVALVEAGLDPGGAQANAIDPSTDSIYTLPAFFAVAAEDPLLSWSFFVNHYSNMNQQSRDPKYVPGKGILYPRGSALGGSSAHNALFFVYPHDADFDDIATLTGDHSWRSENMRRYFERVENCEYCQPAARGHGFHGYFPSNLFDEKVFTLYPQLKDIALAGAVKPSSFYRGNTTLDVNHPLVAAGDTGTFRTPMHVHQNKRISIREHLLDTQAALPDRLFLITGALATRVITHEQKAVGLEFMVGTDLYGADKNFDPSAQGRLVTIRARREVILSAGAFNTPQLLKLSGIGPADELQQLGIPVVVDLPGVGANLQDRYEITTNAPLTAPLDLYTRCLPFQPGDPCLAAFNTGAWTGSDTPFFGPYANNAIFATRIAKSTPDKEVPDLFIAGAPLAFKGYYPGFSQGAVGLDWTWLVLKAHTRNTAGTVKLRSTNPRDTPNITFHYFEEGNDTSGDDLEAVVKGLKMLRRLAAQPDAAPHLEAEALPGPEVQTDRQLRQYARDQAWGHHASCTAKIGARDDRMAVLDSRFRVRGVSGLRVVDASSFPRTPGFYPVAAILMISEKAADAVLEESL